MKHLITITLLLLSTGSFAQYTKDSSHSTAPAILLKPANTTNNINIAPEINTTITKLPQPTNTSNNYNPTTGTVIGLTKQKETTNAVNPLGTGSLEISPAVSTGDTTLRPVKKTPHHKPKKSN